MNSATIAPTRSRKISSKLRAFIRPVQNHREGLLVAEGNMFWSSVYDNTQVMTADHYCLVHLDDDQQPKILATFYDKVQALEAGNLIHMLPVPLGGDISIEPVLAIPSDTPIYDTHTEWAFGW